jgi:hypothetical protein
MAIMAASVLCARQEYPEQKQLEEFLRNAKVDSIDKEKAGGRGASWIIKLSLAGDTKQGFFKYVDRPRPTLAPQSYKYELAAYELTKILGVDIVPPVVEREIDGLRGSLQIYLEDCINEEQRQLKKMEPPDVQAFRNAFEEITVFENLTFCPRLESKDILIHKTSWKVCRVDFAEAFQPTSELLPGAAIGRCSRRLYQGLQKIDQKAITVTLEPYLNSDEIKALLDRRSLILNKLQALIKEKGESAVLFDMKK